MYSSLSKPTKVTFPKMNLTSEEIALAKKALSKWDAENYLCVNLQKLGVRRDHPIYRKIESSLSGYVTIRSYLHNIFRISFLAVSDSNQKELRKIWIRCQEKDLYTVTLLIGPSGHLKARKYE